MKIITLHSGEQCIVDERDFCELSKHKWYCVNGYAVRREGRRTIRMHREIICAETGKTVDHANGNKLDNRRENLRFCTQRENSWNTKSTGAVKFKGVHISRRKCGVLYRSAIRVNGGKPKCLGYFRTPEEAARVYDNAARSLHGEFARLNFS